MVGASVTTVDEAYIEERYDTLRDFIENRYFLTEQFLSEDSQNAVLIVSLEPDAPASKVIDSLKGLAKDSPLRLAPAGNEVIKDTLWSYLIRVLCILPPCAICLVLCVG